MSNTNILRPSFIPIIIVVVLIIESISPQPPPQKEIHAVYHCPHGIQKVTFNVPASLADTVLVQWNERCEIWIYQHLVETMQEGEPDTLIVRTGDKVETFTNLVNMEPEQYRSYIAELLQPIK